MSHVAMLESKAGEPVIVDIDALKMAVSQFPDLEIVKQNTYLWWGSSVGDYPLPEGMTAAELGNNATYVVRVKDAKRKAYQSSFGTYKGTGPFDLAIVEDKNNPGAFVPLYDFFNGGYGLDSVIGPPVLDKDRKVVSIAPKLMQRYHMCCDALAARAAGDEIQFGHTNVQGAWVPNEEAPDGSWESVVNTEVRLGV